MERFNTYCNACVFSSSVLFPLLTCFQRFVCSRGESAVQVMLLAVFSHLVRKLQVHKCSLLLFYLCLHIHKGSRTREGTLDGTSGGWATLFILDSMKLTDISEMQYFNRIEQQKEAVTCRMCAASRRAVRVSNQPGNTCCNDLDTVSLAPDKRNHLVIKGPCSPHLTIKNEV